MGVADVTSPDAVVAAINEFDALGEEEFLRKYGFGRARFYVIVREGKSYPSKAILGAAHAFQHPDEGPLKSKQFNGGTQTTSRLRALGFQIEEAEGAEISDGSLWLIRAGGKGEDEELCLRSGVCGIGWPELSDLSGLDQEQINAQIDSVFPDDSDATRRSSKTQIRDFFAIEPGDLVLMPLKSRDRQIAVGRITGDYEHRPGFGRFANHVRATEWLSQGQSRDQFQALSKWLNRPPTIARVPVPSEAVLEALKSGNPVELPESLPEFVQYAVSLLEAAATTYKHAVMLALAELARRDEEPEDGRIPVRLVAELVAEFYWPQTRPFSAELPALRQTKTGQQLEAIQDIDRVKAESGSNSLQDLLADHPERHEQLMRSLEHKLAAEPLPRMETDEPRIFSVEWSLHVSAGAYWDEATERALQLVPGGWEKLAEGSEELEALTKQRWVRFVASIDGNPSSESQVRSYLFPEASSLHLLIRWSASREPNTIKLHREIAEANGAVWWGKVGDPLKRAAVSAKRRAVLQKQIESGQPTYVFFHRPGETWRARLLQLQSEPPADTNLIPEYYRDRVSDHHLWLRLTDFEELDASYPEEKLTLDDYPEPGSVTVAFRGQSSLFYVRELEASSPTSSISRSTIWWVNQGDSYRQGRDGGFAWAPLLNKVGNPISHWETVDEAAPGDRVLHYAGGHLRAVSRVTAAAEPAPRPPELSDGWAEEGRRLPLEYTELAEPISLEKIPIEARKKQGGPFTAQGSVQQGYFFKLQAPFVAELARLFPELGLGDAPSSSGTTYMPPDFPQILDEVRRAGLAIQEQTLRRYHLSLKTRGFVILSGVSGTGKTWLSELYADAVGANHRLIPVAPNWTTNEDLLGYLNPITSVFQYTPFSQFLREAAAEYESATRDRRAPKPFHVTLDEMNLARVEYYFARFLSAMEVRARYGTAAIELGPDQEVLLTPNLRFTGTVNVDETTHGFADKVYDRAQLVELDAPREILVEQLKGRPYQDVVMEVWDAVVEIAPFAFRVLAEIDSYVIEAEGLGIEWETALDEQLLQKVLPKIKGADLRIDNSLKAIIEIADGRFPLTHDKARKMHAGFVQHQFASYF